MLAATSRDVKFNELGEIELEKAKNAAAVFLKSMAPMPLSSF